MPFHYPAPLPCLFLLLHFWDTALKCLASFLKQWLCKLHGCNLCSNGAPVPISLGRCLLQQQLIIIIIISDNKCKVMLPNPTWKEGKARMVYLGHEIQPEVTSETIHIFIRFILTLIPWAKEEEEEDKGGQRFWVCFLIDCSFNIFRWAVSGSIQHQIPQLFWKLLLSLILVFMFQILAWTAGSQSEKIHGNHDEWFNVFVCMHVHLLITGKLRHHIEVTHSAIEIVVEPAWNPQVRPNTCLGTAQALRGWREQRLWSYTQLSWHESTCYTHWCWWGCSKFPSGAAFPALPTDGTTPAAEFWLPS